jgi:hypothetical protein
MPIREDTGRHIIEEHDAAMFGECRFALDRRDRDDDGTVRLVNVGWYRTYRGAMNALSMERAAEASA